MEIKTLMILTAVLVFMLFMSTATENIIFVVITGIPAAICFAMLLSAVSKQPVPKSRLEVVETSDSGTVVRDVETDVLYVRTGSGISVMLDADGKPILYDENDFKSPRT